MGNGVIVIKEPKVASGKVQICSVDVTDVKRPNGVAFKKGEIINFPASYSGAKVGDLIKFRIVRKVGVPDGAEATTLSKVTTIPCIVKDGQIV